MVADTTYKVIWQGFPVSPIGTVDQDRHFHLLGMGYPQTNRKTILHSSLRH